MGADKKERTLKMEDILRKEIMPGVFLNCLKSGKFKTSIISITLLSQLRRETASLNALIPFVLKRGTTLYPDMKSLSEKLDDLYGAALEPAIRRCGEIQGIGLDAMFPEEKYLPEGANVTLEMINLISEMLLRPATRGGLLINDYVKSEKQNLADLVSSFINEKRSYANMRCMEEMCCYEDISIGKYGSVEDINNINYKKLTKQYHNLLMHSPVEIFYFGQTDEKNVERMFKNALCSMPRGDIDFDIGTDVRMNSVEDKPRYFEEKLDVTQGKLVMGFRLGECMEEPNIPAIQVFNTVFGGGVNSKLFNNVREKMQLCYYAASSCDCHKGIMYAYSGIEFDKFEKAKDEILHQLDDIRTGNISDDELMYAKKAIRSDLYAMTDSQYDLENFYFSNTLAGLDWNPLELAGLVDEVTKEDVMKIAGSVVLDLIYFLRDEEKNDDDDKD